MKYLRRTGAFGRLLFALVLVLALSAAVLAQEQREGPSEDEIAEQVHEAVRQAAEQTRQFIESIPDPSQLSTQFLDRGVQTGVPTKERQFVYSLSVWAYARPNTSELSNPRGEYQWQFAGTFAPLSVDTIYLPANETAVVNAQETEVYYWPITREYMANWFEYREEVPGKLQIERNGQVVALLDRVTYSYYYPDGLGENGVLLLGDEAVETYEDYQNRIDAFYDSTSAYYEAYRVWQLTMDRILAEVRETGQPKKPDEIPEPPTQPQAPQDFAYQPRQAFAVNLPAGRYTVKVIAEDGSVVPNSERTLQVFEARRTGVGFKVRPEHRWTMPENHFEPSTTFYLDGTRVFYVEPYFARGFNYYEYNKMTNLHRPLEAEGTRSRVFWTLDKPILNAKLQVLKDGQVIQEVSYQPYYVRQTAGYGLGYEIVPFDPSHDPLLEGRTPTFYAYRVQLEGEGSRYQLRFVDADGNVIPGSLRGARVVKRPGVWLYAVTAIPLSVGLVVFGWRWSIKRRTPSVPTQDA